MAKANGFGNARTENRHGSRETIYFCEKESGMVRFQVEPDSDGQIPFERAAGLIAMHCLIRGQTPGDYVVLVAARENILGRVVLRAKELLKAGRALAAPVRLSVREQQVLGGILDSLLNKQIAARLSISERTVKFHVSSLLAKFRVHSRMELKARVAIAIDAITTARCSPVPSRGIPRS